MIIMIDTLRIGVLVAVLMAGVMGSGVTQIRELGDFFLSTGERQYIQMNRYFQGKQVIYQLESFKSHFGFEISPAVETVKKVTLNYGIQQVVSVPTSPDRDYHTFIILTLDQYIINCRTRITGGVITIDIQQQLWILSDLHCSQIEHFQDDVFILQCQQIYSPYLDEPITIDLTSTTLPLPLASLAPIPPQKDYVIRIVGHFIYRRTVSPDWERNDRLDIFQVRRDKNNQTSVLSIKSIKLQDYSLHSRPLHIVDLLCWNSTRLFVLDKTYGLMTVQVTFGELFTIQVDMVDDRYSLNQAIVFREIVLGGQDEFLVVTNLFVEFYSVGEEVRLVRRVTIGEEGMQVEKTMRDEGQVFVQMKGPHYDLVKVLDCGKQMVVDQLVFYESVSLYLMGINANIAIPSYATKHYFLLVSQNQKSILRYSPETLLLKGGTSQHNQAYETLKYTVYSDLDKQNTIQGQVRIYPLGNEWAGVQQTRNRAVAIQDSSQVVQLDTYLLGQNMLFEAGTGINNDTGDGTLPLKSTLSGLAEWKVEYETGGVFRETVRLDEETLLLVQQKENNTLVLSSYRVTQDGASRQREQVNPMPSRVDTLCYSDGVIYLFSKKEQGQVHLYLLTRGETGIDIHGRLVTSESVAHHSWENSLNFKCDLGLHSLEALDTSEGYSGSLVGKGALFVKRGGSVEMIRVFLSGGVLAYKTVHSMDTELEGGFWIQVALDERLRRILLLVVSASEKVVQQWLVSDLSELLFMRRLPLYDYLPSQQPPTLFSHWLFLPVSYLGHAYTLSYDLHWPNDKVLRYIHFSPATLLIPSQEQKYHSVFWMQASPDQGTIQVLSPQQLLIQMDDTDQLERHFPMTRQTQILQTILHDARQVSFSGKVPLSVSAAVNQTGVPSSEEKVPFNVTMDSSRVAIKVFSYSQEMNFIKGGSSEEYQVDINQREVDLPIQLKGVIHETLVHNDDSEYSFTLLDFLYQTEVFSLLDPLLPGDQALSLAQSIVILRNQSQTLQILSIPRLTSHFINPVKTLPLSFLKNIFYSPGTPVTCSKLHANQMVDDQVLVHCNSPSSSHLYQMQVTPKYNYNLFRQVNQITLPPQARQVDSVRVAQDKGLLAVLHPRDSRATLVDQEILILALNQTDSQYGGQLIYYSSSVVINLSAIQLSRQTLSLVALQVSMSSSFLYLYLLTADSLLLVALDTLSPDSLSTQSLGLNISHPVALLLHQDRLIIRQRSQSSLMTISCHQYQMSLENNGSVSQAYYLHNSPLQSYSPTHYLGVAFDQEGRQLLQATRLTPPLGIDQMMQLSSAAVAVTGISGLETGMLLQDGSFVRLALRQSRRVSVDSCTTGEQMVQRVRVTSSNRHFNNTYSFQFMVNLDQHTREYILLYCLVVSPSTLALLVLLAYFHRKESHRPREMSLL